MFHNSMKMKGGGSLEIPLVLIFILGFCPASSCANLVHIYNVLHWVEHDTFSVLVDSLCTVRPMRADLSVDRISEST